MKLIETDGIVLKTMDFKENDSILTFLTPEAGKIAGVLHGGKSTRSGNSAKTELFVTNHLEFSVKTGAELVRIRKCELLVSHAQIRQNFSKFLLHSAVFLLHSMHLLNVLGGLQLKIEWHDSILSIFRSTADHFL